MRKTVAVLGLITLSIGGAPYAVGAPSPREVTIYDATQLAFDRYEVVKRIGVEDWRSAFRIRSYETVAAARQALAGEAASLGADGVINLTCFDRADGLFAPAGHFCYGNAIRLKSSGGK